MAPIKTRQNPIHWVRKVQPEPGRRRLIGQAIWITLLGNTVLAAGKALAAYFTGSVALYADAANSISDVVYSLLLAMGLQLAQRAPDSSHPQGHDRFEPLVGLAVAASITFAGFKAAQAAVERLISGPIAIDPSLPTLVLIGAMAIKSLMYWRILWIARKTASPVFAAAAQDNLADVLTSLAAFLGAIGSRYLWPILDPLAGLVVAAWIFRTAFFIWRENIGYLTGAGADWVLRERIAKAAQEVAGVEGVHQLLTDYVGTRLVVELHLDVRGDLHLEQSHAIADQVEQKLLEIPQIDRVYVHLEPLPSEAVI